MPTDQATGVQLVVTHNDNTVTYYRVTDSWKVKADMRCIVVGRDLDRTYVPLDGVRYFTVEPLAAEGAA